MDIAQRLRSEGFKVTPQRLAIYDALLKYDLHPTAECIYRNIHEEYPTISLATVYKTMEIFAKVGLVRILNIGNEPSRYDYDVHPHPHIRCMECGNVEDVVNMDVEEIFHKIQENSNYEVLRAEIAFEGICPRCKTRRH